MDPTRSRNRIPLLHSILPPNLRGVLTPKTFLDTAVAPDSECPLDLRLLSPPHLESFPSVTSAADAYVVYSFEVRDCNASFCADVLIDAFRVIHTRLTETGF